MKITKEEYELLLSEKGNLERAKKGWTRRIPDAKLTKMYDIVAKTYNIQRSLTCPSCILEMLKLASAIMHAYEREDLVNESKTTKSKESKTTKSKNQKFIYKKVN